MIQACTEERYICCPYCGEQIEIIVDLSVESQSYIEDCSVCCRPIELSVFIDGDRPNILCRRDDE